MSFSFLDFYFSRIQVAATAHCQTQGITTVRRHLTLRPNTSKVKSLEGKTKANGTLTNSFSTNKCTVQLFCIPLLISSYMFHLTAIIMEFTPTLLKLPVIKPSSTVYANQMYGL